MINTSFNCIVKLIYLSSRGRRPKKSNHVNLVMCCYVCSISFLRPYIKTNWYQTLGVIKGYLLNQISSGPQIVQIDWGRSEGHDRIVIEDERLVLWFRIREEECRVVVDLIFVLDLQKIKNRKLQIRVFSRWILQKIKRSQGGPLAVSKEKPRQTLVPFSATENPVSVSWSTR